MNLIEAIKSGKRFRRECWTNRDWIDMTQERLNLPMEAIIAEDWEVEEKQVTITSAQFDAIVDKLGTYGEQLYWAELMKKELGL